MNLIVKTMLIGVAPLVMQASVLTGNLLTNPGAESGLTGWTLTAGGTETGAGVDNGSFDPGINPHSGSYDFYGGDGNGFSLGGIQQTVSIVTGSVTTTLIDAGGVSADVSFWEQSLNQGTPSDEAYIKLTYLSGSNSVLGTNSSPAEYSLGSWTNYTDNFVVPTGTRSIEYTMEFQLEDGENIDSFVDDNSLTIAGAATTATPEPSTFGALLIGIAALGVGVIRRNRTAVAQ
jgi:hypothetical protein